MAVITYQQNGNKYPTTVPQEMEKETSKTLEILLVSVSIRHGVFQQVAASVSEENTASLFRVIFLHL